MKLNDNSMTPLYRQVLEDIKAGIASGHYQPGAKIPSEAELSQMYSVSRVTGRRAIEQLSREGLLTSRQGKGTYVNQGKALEKLSQPGNSVSFSEVCNQVGLRAGTQKLERRVLPATQRHREVFGEECDRVVEVTCVRTADGVPVMAEDSALPYDSFAFLLDTQLDGTSSVDLVYEHTGRLAKSCVNNTLEISQANARMARDLGVNAGDALFVQSVVLADQDGRPICMTDRYSVGTRYQFAL